MSTMQTSTNAAAVADMESELRQLRQQNKELRSRLEVLTKTNSQRDQHAAGGGRKNSRSTTPPNNNVTADDNYQLYRTPDQTPEQNNDDAKNIHNNESRGVKMNSSLLHEVEMGTLESSHNKSRQQQHHLKMKKNRDGGGNYERAPSHGVGDEEEPALIINDNGDDSDVFIDDDSHNKHQGRRKNHQGNYSSSSSGIAATSHNFPPFTEQIRERAGWLIGLLFFQSCSSFIIAYNEQFLQTHMVIVQFLTMLVGAGGNAGNQSAVGVIRGLAVGIINGHTWKAYLKQEAKMALGLSFLIGLTGFIRAAMFRTPWGETIAITTSVSIIVVTSVAIGSTLPLAMKKVGIDPAHSSTTIQVVMDILGVLITVCVSSFVMSFQVFQSETDQVTDDAYQIDTADVGG